MSFVICGPSTTEAKSWLSNLTYFLPPTAISCFLQCFWFSKVVCICGFHLWLLLAPFPVRGLNIGVWHYSWGDANNCLLTQVGNWWQTKARILPMSNLVGQWVLLELLTEIWVKGLLTRAERAQRHLHHEKPTATAAWVTAHKSGKPRGQCMHTDSWISWRESFADNSIALSLS